MRKGCAVTCGVLPKICKIAKKGEKRNLLKGCVKDAHGQFVGSPEYSKIQNEISREYNRTSFIYRTQSYLYVFKSLRSKTTIDFSMFATWSIMYVVLVE